MSNIDPNYQRKPGGPLLEGKFSLVQAFRCAGNGVAVTARGRNFRIQMGVGVLAVVLGFAFRIDPSEWIAIVVCIGMVLAFESVNTAVEAVADLVSPEYHPLAKVSKDAVAGAALLASAASFIVGVMIFLPKIVALIGW